MNQPYPTWICFDCGSLYGRRKEPGVCTVHQDTCDVCGETKPCTEPRDFGHLYVDWQKHKRVKEN